LRSERNLETKSKGFQKLRIYTIKEKMVMYGRDIDKENVRVPNSQHWNNLSSKIKK
jgi:hypothetical protein